MRIFQSFAAAVLVFALASSGSGIARTRGDSTPIIAPGDGNGGHIPSPFDTSNRKVELASGEYYELVGRVVLPPPAYRDLGKFSAFIEVDLKTHPWLANKARVDDPLYPLEGPLSIWKPYLGFKVVVLVKASGRVVGSEDGAEYVISLRQVRNRAREAVRIYPEGPGSDEVRSKR